MNLAYNFRIANNKVRPNQSNCFVRGDHFLVSVIVQLDANASSCESLRLVDIRAFTPLLSGRKRGGKRLNSFEILRVSDRSITGGRHGHPLIVFFETINWWLPRPVSIAHITRSWKQNINSDIVISSRNVISGGMRFIFDLFYSLTGKQWEIRLAMMNNTRFFGGGIFFPSTIAIRM